MANIQFCYAYSDSDIVEYLSNRLTEDKHNIINFEPTIIGEKIGEKIRKVFMKNLQSADILIIVISNNSINSAWTNSEINMAVGYNQERMKPFILPILFDNVPIPDALQNYLVRFEQRDNLLNTSEKLSYTISKLSGELQAIEDEKKDVIARVEKNIGVYVNDSIDRLRKSESNYQKIAYLCYSMCGVSLLIAVVYLLIKANQLIGSGELQSVSLQIQMGLLGFVILALIISISRFLFLIGKSFMVESLRNSDRIHAISFGKFYLNAFGEKAEWEEIKEAFQHWNIDKGSTFISQNASDFDPEIFKNIIEFTKLITNKSEK